MKITIGVFVLELPADLAFETFEAQDFHGISFVVDRVQYDVLHNRVLGERLLIVEAPGHLKDIPFHMGTVSFLPRTVQVSHAPIV